jgi:hypothetical protein
MSERDNGGPAFPEVRSELRGDQGDYHTEIFSDGGMTLRDYFAAKAMAALLATPIGNWPADLGSPSVAAAAYEQADAMLKERAK